MDQSKSNSSTDVVLPQRSLKTEFFVGLFTMLGVAAAGYLAVGLGDLEVGISKTYDVSTVFNNISGLKRGASVEIAGVPIGEVSNIALIKNQDAQVTLRINKSVPIFADDSAVIRTKGIIGDRYVKITRGSSDKVVTDGGQLFNSDGVVDFEDIISGIVHSLTGGKDKGDKDE